MDQFPKDKHKMYAKQLPLFPMFTISDILMIYYCFFIGGGGGEYSGLFFG